MTRPVRSSTGAPSAIPAPANIRHVAEAAGVSHQTVSRVLNNSPAVRASTRENVLRHMENLNYRPSRAARTLASGRVRAVTVITSDTTLYGYAKTLQGVEEAARDTGFGVGVWVVKSVTRSAIAAAVEHVADPSAGALVIVGFDSVGRRVLAALPAGLPSVVATGPRPGQPAPGRLWLDETAGGREATEHLLALGHRTVHHVPTPMPTRMGRAAGWRRALTVAGRVVPALPAPGWDAGAGYAAGLSLAGDPAVTAILCGNDDLAVGVRRALYEAGQDVPGDVSIVGFDDSPLAAYWSPALTSVRMDFVGLGRAAFAAAAALLGGTPPPPPLLERPYLVLRESTGPAPRP